MIEQMMYFAIGFLVAALSGLGIVPLVHARAVRLTIKRLEAATPLSMAEIQADKDQLRAEFAMSARRLEISLEQLKGHYEKNNDDENLERFLESFNADKKKANYARRQSNLDSLPKGSSPTNAGYRNTTLPQGLKGIDEVDEGNPQEEEISR